MPLGLSPDVFDHSLLPLLSVQDLLTLRLVNKELTKAVNDSNVWRYRSVLDFQEGLPAKKPLIDEYFERAQATLQVSYRKDPDNKLLVPIKRNKQVRDIVFTSAMHILLYSNGKAGFYQASYEDNKVTTCWFGTPTGRHLQIKRIGPYVALLESGGRLRLFCYVPQYKSPAEVRHELNLPGCNQLSDLNMDNSLWAKSEDGTKVFHIQACHVAGARTTFESRTIYDSNEPVTANTTNGLDMALADICSATLCANAQTGKGYKCPAALFSGKPAFELTYSLECLIAVTNSGLMVARWNLLKQYNGIERAPVQLASEMNSQLLEGERFVHVRACECLVAAVTNFGRVIDGVLYIDMNAEQPLQWTMVRHVPGVAQVSGISYLNIDHEGNTGCIHGVGYSTNGAQVRWFRELYREQGSKFVPLEAVLPYRFAKDEIDDCYGVLNNVRP